MSDTTNDSVLDQFKQWLEPKTVIKAQFPEGTLGYSWLYAAFADGYKAGAEQALEQP